MKSHDRRRPAGAMPFAILAASAALAACSPSGESGVVDDPHGTSPDVRLNCNGTCVPSNTVATDAMRAEFYIVDDGSRTQAQAGFHSKDAFFDIELEPGDVLNFIDGTKTARMALPRPPAGTEVDVGTPYIVDFTSMPTAAHDGQFQLVRANQTLVSTVTLPAPFRILAPASGARAHFTDEAMTIALDSVPPAPKFTIYGQDCRRQDGTDTHYGYAGTDQSLFTTQDGVHFTFHVSAYASQAYPGEDGTQVPMKSCTVFMQVTALLEGTLADGFKAGSVIEGLQERKIQFVLEE